MSSYESLNTFKAEPQILPPEQKNLDWSSFPPKYVSENITNMCVIFKGNNCAHLLK